MMKCGRPLRRASSPAASSSLRLRRSRGGDSLPLLPLLPGAPGGAVRCLPRPLALPDMRMLFFRSQVALAAGLAAELLGALAPRFFLLQRGALLDLVLAHDHLADRALHCAGGHAAAARAAARAFRLTSSSWWAAGASSKLPHRRAISISRRSRSRSRFTWERDYL